MRPAVIMKTFQTWRAFKQSNKNVRMRPTSDDGQLEFADKPLWVTLGNSGKWIFFQIPQNSASMFLF
jgi:hypothetical protein